MTIKTKQVGRLSTTISATRHGFITVTYHTTHVVKFNQRKIVLNTGGYQTATTLARMNQASSQYALGFRVFQKNFRLFVEKDGVTVPFKGRTATLVR